MKRYYFFGVLLVLSFGLFAPQAHASASISIGSSTLASDGVTLAVHMSGVSGVLSPANGATGFTVHVGTTEYNISTTTASGSTVTLTLDAFIATTSTVTIDLATSPTSNLTDTGGDTPAGQSGLSVTDNSTQTLVAVPYNNANVYFLNPISLGNYSSRSDVIFAVTGYSQDEISTEVSGTDANILLLGGVGASYTISVDGGNATTISPSLNSWEWYSLFKGLANTTHTLTITGPYFDQTSLIQVKGSTGTQLISGYGTFLPVLSTPFSTSSAIDGSYTYINGATNNDVLTMAAGSNGSVRFTAAVTDIWMFSLGSEVALYRDGVQVVIASSSAIGFNFGMVHLASGLDGQTHNYEIANVSSSDPFYLYGLMLGGGTGLASTTQSGSKDTWAFYGDSITADQGLSSSGEYDDRPGDAWILTRQLGTVSSIEGVGGSLTSTYGRDHTSSVTGLSPTPKRVFVRYGTNDLDQAGGIPLANFQADYKTMIQNIRTGLPSAKIYLEEIFPTTRTPGTYGSRSDYNAAIATDYSQLADANTVLVNTDNWFSPTTDTYDGSLHPNASGYAKIANREIPLASSTGYTVIGPSVGTAGQASTNFTVTIAAGSTFTGDETVTISDGSNGGTFTPSVGSSGVSSVTVTPTNGASSFTFTYTPASAGVKTLTFTNGQSWIDVGASTYTVASAGGCGSTNTVVGNKVYVTSCGSTYSYQFTPHTASSGVSLPASSSTIPTSTSTSNTGGTSTIPVISLPPISSQSSHFFFTKTLTVGMKDTEVTLLQKYLNTHGYTLALTGPGSAGNETVMFGVLTKVALAKFQKAVGITPAVGYFGPITRAYINSHQQ